MYYFKATIQYEGTNYSGLQWQTGLRTIQSEINTALSELMAGKVTTTFASRTDTGVHALEQIMKISSASPINLSNFKTLLNNILPNQIKCLSIEKCEGRFKPSTQARSKEYRYLFTNKTQISTQDKQFIANISNKLDFNSIEHCLKLLMGSNDFCNFYSSGSNVKSTIRKVELCELSSINPHTLFLGLDLFKIPPNTNQCFELRIIGNGFLKQMIRHLVSSLWMVGSGKLTVEEFRDLLKGSKVDKQKWKVAPANGLYLYRINI